MKRVNQSTFERKCREGAWEAMRDATRAGYVEVRVCASGRRMTVQVERAR